MKLEDRVEFAYNRVLVFGLPGAGKSTLVAKLVKDGYTLHWITLDNDVDILRKLPREYWKDINVYDIPDSADFPVASETLMRVFKDKKGSICHAHGKISCIVCKKLGDSAVSTLDLTSLGPKDIVVIDTATQLGHSILAYITKAQNVEYKPERDDWGGVRKFTEFYCSQWQAAKFNLAVICHVVEAKTSEEKTKLVPAFGSKNMSVIIAKAFSHVVYCEVVNKKHKAFCATTYSNNVLTKSRTDFEIEKLAEPSLAPIFEGLIAETIQSKQEVVQKLVEKVETKVNSFRENYDKTQAAKKLLQEKQNELGSGS